MNYRRIMVTGIAVMVGFMMMGKNIRVCAQVPQLINYQGKLTDSAGDPVADGEYGMRFSLYDAESGGTLVWGPEEWSVSTQRVTVNDGLFNVLLGMNEPLSSAAFDAPYWLEVEVYNENSTDWETFDPRRQLVSAPYALRAASLAEGGDVHVDDITIDGNVGLGTASPTELLHLSQEGDTAIRFQSLQVPGAGDAAVAGPASPATAENDWSTGALSWIAPGNVASSDNICARVYFSGAIHYESVYLKVTGFGFTIPDDAVIEGIEVEVEKKKSASSVEDAKARIVRGGSIGSADRALEGRWGSIEDYYRYGGADDLWGENWDVTDINGSGFGFALSAVGIYGDGYVDHIRITVYYRLPGEVNWTMGSDWSDDGSFKISASTAPGTADHITLTAAGNLGVGTSNPLSMLDVAGAAHLRGVAGGTGLYVNSNGSVGIGTTSPGTLLEIAAPSSELPTVILGRNTGNPSVRGTSDLILDGSATDGWAYLNYYSTGDVVLAQGGGKVGIGTTDPDVPLTVSSESATLLVLERTSPYNANMAFRTTDAIAYAGVSTYNNFSIGPNADLEDSPWFVIQSSNGNVGIGTTTPQDALDIAGNMKIGTSYNASSITFNDDNGVDYAITNGNIANNVLSINADGQSRIAINGSGKVGIGTTDPTHLLHVAGIARSTQSSWATSSDIRLKDIAGEYEYGIDEITRINPVRFTYKEDNPLELPTDTEFVGVIAQELQAVIPEAVEKAGDGYLTVQNDPVFWAVVNAVKELKVENEALRMENKVIKGDNEELKEEINNIKQLLGM